MHPLQYIEFVKSVSTVLHNIHPKQSLQLKIPDSRPKYPDQILSSGTPGWWARGWQRTSWRTAIGCCGRSWWPSGRWQVRSAAVQAWRERENIMIAQQRIVGRFLWTPRRVSVIIAVGWLASIRISIGIVRCSPVFLIQVWNVKIELATLVRGASARTML